MNITSVPVRNVVSRAMPADAGPLLTTKKQSSNKLGPPFKVLLHNDMNKREYVVKVLVKVVQELTIEHALGVMQEAHVNGLALVTSTAQDRAEQYVEGLRGHGLTSSLEPDM